VTPLLKALLADGYSVQLAHVEAEKDETRDIVRVKTSSGEMVAEDKDMQHNRNYRAIKERTAAMVAAVVSKVPAQSDSEGSTAATSEEKS